MTGRILMFVQKKMLVQGTKKETHGQIPFKEVTATPGDAVVLLPLPASDRLPAEGHWILKKKQRSPM